MRGESCGGCFAIGTGNRNDRDPAVRTFWKQHVDHWFGYISRKSIGRFNMHSKTRGGIHFQNSAAIFEQ